MDKNKIIYWISTGLLSALMLFSASMYFLKTEEVKQVFETLGHPAHIVIPLAVAKLLGLVAILTRRSRMLMEWAYAGFCFDLILAAMAHLNANDGGHVPAMIGIVLLLVSYFYEKKV